MRAIRSALVAVLIGSVVAGCGGGEVFYRADPGDVERVPATPRAIAAALLDHLEDEDVAAVGGVEELLPEAGPDGGRVLIATARIADAELSVSVTPEDPATTGAALCGELAEHCRDAVATDAAGDRTPYQVLWQPADRAGSDQGTAGMVLLRGESRVSVTLHGPEIPRGVEWTRLPVGRTVLESILLDPAIAAETLPELVDDGERIDGFVDRAFGL